VLQALPFPIAGPVPIWRRLFCWICLLPLLLVLLRKSRDGNWISPRQSFWLGYGCGFAWYAANCYWIYQTMYLYGGLPRPVALGILILFSLYLGLYHGLFAWIVARWRSAFGVKWALAAAPFVWVAVELARGRVTGFPWDLLGYTQVDHSALTSLAPVAGVYGMSLVIALVNCAMAAVLLLERRRSVVTTAVMGVVVAALVQSAGIVRPAGETSRREVQKAVLLQENLSVGAESHGESETEQQLLASFEALSHAPQGATVVLWPESPAPFQWDDGRTAAAMKAFAAREKTPVIADAIKMDAGQKGRRYYNTAQAFSADGNLAGRYDKVHLVPFGEYVPFKDAFFFAKNLTQEVGDFSRGASRNVLSVDGHGYGTFICYESIFGDEVRQFAKHGADVLVNLSDDGWYGDTSAPWEHLDMVRMRAIENHRWVLRATNTGVTTAIDPEGRLHAEAPRHQRLAVTAEFQFEEGTTFYTRHGDWIAYVCAMLTAGGLLWSFARPRAEPGKVHWKHVE
jgi:apolipoprotein N-acyltransferase